MPQAVFVHNACMLSLLRVFLPRRLGRCAGLWVGLWMLAGVLGWTGAATAQERTVRVGVYANAPKIFADANGRPSGIFGDLLAAIAEREGWRLQPVPCEWQACLEALAAGEIDLMPDVAYSEERAERFSFHKEPTLNSWSQVYARPQSGIESVLDLRDRRVAVLAGSVQESYLRQLLASFGVPVQWQPVQNLSDGFVQVAHGEADAVVANHFFGNLQAPQASLVATAIMFQPSALFFASGQGRNADLLAAIDRRLQAWRADPDSVYYDILQRWAADLTTRVPRAFWWGLGGVLALLALAMAGVVWLRRQVAFKTRSLQASEARLNTILNSVEACIYIKDRQLRYQYVNHKIEELFGQPASQILGHTDEGFFDDESVARLQANDRRVLEQGETVRQEETNRLPGDGEARTYFSVKLPLRRPDGQIYALCGISTDLTDYRRIQAEIHQLAFYDPLTGLPNRRMLLDRLQQGLAASARSGHNGALLFIDLDNFKTLNDTLGHDKGDVLLQQMAVRLGEHIRPRDLLARLGGDEFVVMLTELIGSPAEAARVAETVADKLLLTLARPYQLGSHPHESTVSIGVALFSDAQGTVEDMLKRADMAMYEAKAQGRNTVRFFNPDMQAVVQARAELEADLREALAKQQFLLHFQPQVDGQGRVLGAEALLRWQHQARGAVSPAEFIGVAESSGLILPIGRWILRSACEQLVHWSRHTVTAEWKLAVNVSARQFRHADFVADVLDALHSTGANPQRLELELTESQLVEDIDGVIAKMGALRAHGVHFALDDFGTGYSSLNYLRRLPLSKLKIDKSFVDNLADEANDAAIVRTVVALGASLKLAVIAEGVETEGQCAALAQAGCLQYQGYLFGRPVPAEVLEARFASGGVA